MTIGAARDPGADAARRPGSGDSPRDAVPARPGGCRRADQQRWVRRLRLQRQLHDGASLRISALAVQLGVLRHRVTDADPGLGASIEGLQDELHTVLQELREVAREIYPPVLDEAGLAAALREALDGAAVPVRVTGTADRFGAAVEGAAYAAVTDCVRALEPGGPPVDVTVDREGDELVVVLRGVPVAHAPDMLDQVRGLGGRVTDVGGRVTDVGDRDGDGRGRGSASTIRVTIPCG